MVFRYYQSSSVSFSTDTVLIVKWQPVPAPEMQKNSMAWLNQAKGSVSRRSPRQAAIAFRMSRLRLRDSEKVGLIAVEKQPVFVCFSNTVPHRAQLLTTVRLPLAGPSDRWDRMLADG
jgi:hypothetical protein